MKVLHVISSLDPKSGGPAEGLRSIALEVMALGNEVEVLCFDAPDSAFIKSFPAKVHTLSSSLGKYGYCRQLVPWLTSRRAEYDVVVVNGLWQYHSFGVWRALAGTSTPYFVFTHGMLDPWFKYTYPLKHLKKWLYWPWAEYRVLRDACAVIFTCEEERVLARQSFWLYRVNEAVTSYGASPPPADDGLSARFLSRNPQLQGKQLLLFLSRIHEKKGCDLLIEAFAEVADRYPDLHLVMAGPDQTGWMAELKQLAARRQLAERITWTGMLQGDDKWGAFYAADAFCLPSHQENFGIVVAEALACSKPVLISNKINIWREIESDGAGIVRDDSLEGTIDGLNAWLAMSAQAKDSMREAASRSFNTRFRIDRVANRLIDIINSRLKSTAQNGAMRSV